MFCNVWRSMRYATVFFLMTQVAIAQPDIFVPPTNSFDGALATYASNSVDTTQSWWSSTWDATPFWIKAASIAGAVVCAGLASAWVHKKVKERKARTKNIAQSRERSEPKQESKPLDSPGKPAQVVVFDNQQGGSDKQTRKKGDTNTDMVSNFDEYPHIAFMCDLDKSSKLQTFRSFLYNQRYNASSSNPAKIQQAIDRVAGLSITDLAQRIPDCLVGASLMSLVYERIEVPNNFGGEWKIPNTYTLCVIFLDCYMAARTIRHGKMTKKEYEILCSGIENMLGEDYQSELRKSSSMARTIINQTSRSTDNDAEFQLQKAYVDMLSALAALDSRGSLQEQFFAFVDSYLSDHYLPASPKSNLTTYGTTNPKSSQSANNSDQHGPAVRATSKCSIVSENADDPVRIHAAKNRITSLTMRSKEGGKYVGEELLASIITRLAPNSDQERLACLLLLDCVLRVLVKDAAEISLTLYKIITKSIQDLTDCTKRKSEAQKLISDLVSLASRGIKESSESEFNTAARTFLTALGTFSDAGNVLSLVERYLMSWYTTTSVQQPIVQYDGDGSEHRGSGNQIEVLPFKTDMLSVSADSASSSIEKNDDDEEEKRIKQQFNTSRWEAAFERVSSQYSKTADGKIKLVEEMLAFIERNQVIPIEELSLVQKRVCCIVFLDYLYDVIGEYLWTEWGVERKIKNIYDQKLLTNVSSEITSFISSNKYNLDQARYTSNKESIARYTRGAAFLEECSRALSELNCNYYNNFSKFHVYTPDILSLIKKHLVPWYAQDESQEI